METESKVAIKLHRRNSVEQNNKVIERALWTTPEVKQLRENIKRTMKFDMKDEKSFPVSDPSFSFRKMKEKLREANVSSGFPQLLRAGIQTLVNAMYQAVTETGYEQWTHVVQSTLDTELYAPLQGLTFPGEVPAGGKYIESSVLGLDIKLRNRKFGEIFPVQKELLEDDQTGQMHQMVGYMAEYAKLIWEVYAYGKLASVANTAYSNLQVPTSETKPAEESVYPWSTALVGGGATRPVAYGALNQANIQAGIIALYNQLNKLGLKMMVHPDTILISPHYKFDLSILLNSAWYPSGAAATGNTGGAFAINPIKGIANAVESRYQFNNLGSANADSKSWYVVDGKKPWFVVQMREPASVVQENPESGESFDRDVYRWKMSVRGNADFIDPRFAWQGSDGSV